jgi:hypothetical protein
VENNPPSVTASTVPTTKTIAATGGSVLGGAITVLILFWTGWDKLDPKVVGALTTLITGAVAFLSAYFIPPGAGEAVLLTIEGKSKTGRAVG